MSTRCIDRSLESPQSFDSATRKFDTGFTAEEFQNIKRGLHINDSLTSKLELVEKCVCDAHFSKCIVRAAEEGVNGTRITIMTDEVVPMASSSTYKGEEGTQTRGK